MLSDDVRTRIADEVEALAGRVQLAGDLSDLVKRNALPPSPVFAFVLPLALRAVSSGDASAGAYLQQVEETVAVLIGLNGAGDATGAKGLPKIDELQSGVIAALCGWAPASDEAPFAASGVMRLSQSQLIEAGSGLVLAQIDFILPRQLRILS